jgi:hypothetical protein
VLTDDGGAIAVLPQAETSLAMAAPAPPPAPAPAAEMDEEVMDKVAESSALSGSGPSERRRSKKEAMAPRSAKPMPMNRMVRAEPLASAPSRTRNLAALASVAVAGGATRYVLPNPVTVPDNNATMLLLADKEVPGESTYLFAPDSGVPESASHPFRVARFTNKTGGLLERGPLAFFGEGGFLGQGVIDPLPDGASATVPFGLERGLAVERSAEHIEEGARLYQVEGSTLLIERQVGPRTRYTAKSGVGESHTLWVKHMRASGYKLIGAPKGTEDNVGTGSALVPIELAGHASKELVLDERVGRPQQVDWLNPLAEDAVKEYLASPEGRGEMGKQLQTAWTIRQDWKRLSDESERLTAEQNDLQTATEETRENLRAIEKNKAAEDLRKTLTARLTKSSARLDEVTKRLIAVNMQSKELELRFREACKQVRISVRK